MLDKKKLDEYSKVRHTLDPSIICHAPFTSLYFEQSGHALACCYNRTHILGTYPQNTIQEIWLGSKAEELRQTIEANVLPPGCKICHSQFSSGNFGGLLARQFDSLAVAPGPTPKVMNAPMPKLISFEISNVCNLECKMCNGYFSSSIRENREKLPPLPFPYDDGFLKQLEPFIPYLKQAKFLGGEPFLIQIYFQIWGMIAELNPDIDVSITTNGTVLNKKVKNALEGLRSHIVMSIDSLEKANYERIRRNARFDKVMEHYSYFRDYTKKKGTQLIFACCPMQQNWWEISSIVEFCNAEEIDVYFNTVTWPPESSLQALKDSDLNEVIEFLESKTLKSNTEIGVRNISRYTDLVNQIRSYRKEIAA